VESTLEIISVPTGERRIVYRAKRYFEAPNWSPDGKSLLFLSYGQDVKGPPANQDVALRILSLPGGKPKVIARLFGGQGTINVPSWSPDSRFAAFVSYRLAAP